MISDVDCESSPETTQTSARDRAGVRPMCEHVVVSRSDVVCSARQGLDCSRLLVYVFNLSCLLACSSGESQSQSDRSDSELSAATLPHQVGHLIFGG